jgi:hypothetical protein
MTETIATSQVEPSDPRFLAALDARGVRTWADPAFPYALAGAGTATKGAAGAPEVLDDDETHELSGNGHQPATGAETPSEATAAAVCGAVLVLSGGEPGAIGVIVRPGYFKGEVLPIALLRDLALPADTAAQRALIEAAVGFARDRGARVAIIGARGADAPAADLHSGFGTVPAFRRVAEFRTIRVVPALWKLEEPEYKVMGATRTEIPALAYLLDFFRRGLEFAPPVDEQAFMAGVERCPNLKVTDFRLARYKHELVAMAAVWEPGAARGANLESAGPAETLLSLAGKVLGRLSPFPRLPGAGGPLRVRYVRNYASKQGHPGVLKYLLDRIGNETRKVGAHAYEIALPTGSDLLSCVPGRLRRVRTPSVWAAPLAAGVDLDGLKEVDPGILDPGF